MVDREVVSRRLHSLDESLKILGELRLYSLEEFLASPERYGSAERFLQISLESLQVCRVRAGRRDDPHADYAQGGQVSPP